ncbi:TetR/AcrR family transcriptional regulator [uncultured Dechloromonas sp.]|uniref:TetR/AcrR family transcriptional regulator n=1 Tax=uncultured Dechloromonas sp. TaxID=171719 RepID=UPI0025CE5783|nr:TetR/AcrR family transcriptional regulator [uncultured Dechloromonas sp.]
MNAPEPKPYHHGELRPALLAAANGIIREAGVDALSMRRLADQVGVSRMAPYHHFKDKNDLLCAIAEMGFADQDRMIRSVIDDIGTEDGARLFENWVHAYIRFAHDNPETYDLMYGKEIWKRGAPTPVLHQVSRASFRLWVDMVGKLQLQGVLPATHPALRTAQASWATLHGLARLLNDGVYVLSGDLDEIANTAVDLLTQRTGGSQTPGAPA